MNINVINKILDLFYKKQIVPITTSDGVKYMIFSDYMFLKVKLLYAKIKSLLNKGEVYFVVDEGLIIAEYINGIMSRNINLTDDQIISIKTIEKFINNIIK